MNLQNWKRNWDCKKRSKQRTRLVVKCFTSLYKPGWSTNGKSVMLYDSLIVETVFWAKYHWFNSCSEMIHVYADARHSGLDRLANHIVTRLSQRTFYSYFCLETTSFWCARSSPRPVQIHKTKIIHPSKTRLYRSITNSSCQSTVTKVTSTMRNVEANGCFYL
jgi:hypothetical protein